MDVDQTRKLVLISRDPRSYSGSTGSDPGDADPNGATNIAGVYVVDAKDPAALRLLSFQQLPTGHTTTCINDCQWLWTGGPAPTTTKQQQRRWAGRAGRSSSPTCAIPPTRSATRSPSTVDLFRSDGVTAYSHDVQVDDMGIAWVSGDGGTRGYWTDGHALRPAHRPDRAATPLNPIPYGGGGFQKRWSRTLTAASSTTPSGPSARTRRAPTAAASTCSRPRRTSAMPSWAARTAGISSSAR